MKESFLKEVELELGSRGPTGLCPSSFLHLNMRSNNLDFSDVLGRATPSWWASRPQNSTDPRQKISHMEGTQIEGGTLENLKRILQPTKNQSDNSKHCQWQNTSPFQSRCSHPLLSWHSTAITSTWGSLLPILTLAQGELSHLYKPQFPTLWNGQGNI